MIINLSNYNGHWQTKELSSLGQFQRGKSRHRPRNDKALFEGGTYPLIQTGDIKAANLYVRSHSEAYNDFGLKQSKLWPKNTLCITIAANIAETALLGYPMCFPDSVVGFHAKDEETSELFMHYVFTFIRRTIQSSTSGSIQDNINIDYLTGLKFKVPFKDEQDKIVEILSLLDTKIELNNRINSELESMAKLIYDYWFVQFDFPISAAQAKAMGRPELEGKPYKSSGGKMLWNGELKREVPEGWVDGQLKDIAKITMGQSPPGSSYNEENDGSVFYQGCTDFGPRFPTVRKYTTAPSRFAKAGDILLSVRAPVGTMNIANEDCCIGRGLAALKSKNGTDAYLYEVMKYFKQIFDRRNTDGTTFGAITKDDLFSLSLVIPPLNLIKAYEGAVGGAYMKLNVMEAENRELASLRDWLLPMLMNGQVRVREDEGLRIAAEPREEYKSKL